MPVKAPSMPQLHILAKSKGMAIQVGLCGTYISPIGNHTTTIITVADTTHLTKPEQRRVIKGALNAL